MINKIKETILSLHISIELISSVSNSMYDLIVFCSKIDPYTQSNQNNLEYFFSIHNFNPDVLTNELKEASLNLEKNFFNQKKLNNASEIEKNYIIELRNNFFGLFHFLETYKLKDNFSDDDLSSLINIFSLVINTLKKLEKLYILEIKQNNNLNKEQRKRELKIILDFLFKINDIYQEMNKTSLFFILKKDTLFIKSNIWQYISNNRLNFYKKEIRGALNKIEEGFLSKKVYFGSILSVHHMLIKEIQELEAKKEMQERTLENILEYTSKIDMNKRSESTNKKVQDFKSIENKSKELSHVLSKAKDINTAINHMQKGKDLQVYFSKDEEETYISNDYRKETKSEISQKAKVNTWFEYGLKKNSDAQTYEQKMTATTMGIPLAELLKQSGLDPEMFSKYNKK